MIIFNHPCFPRQIEAFPAPDSAVCRAPLDCQKARSAPNMQTIKPNKAESKKRRYRPTRHRGASDSRACGADLHFAEEVSLEQLQKEGVHEHGIVGRWSGNSGRACRRRRGGLAYGPRAEGDRQLENRPGAPVKSAFWKVVSAILVIELLLDIFLNSRSGWVLWDLASLCVSIYWVGREHRERP
jgi:hypothetical protein